MKSNVKKFLRVLLHNFHFVSLSSIIDQNPIQNVDRFIRQTQLTIAFAAAVMFMKWLLNRTR